MNEKPILFSTEMVKAILEGRKTQTRRIIKPMYADGSDLTDIVKWNQPFSLNGYKELFETGGQYWDAITNYKLDSGAIRLKESSRRACPYGKVGDSLWVRETWAKVSVPNGTTAREIITVYKADNPQGLLVPDKWKPSIFMPRDASRINLEITNIRVERLQDISLDDVLAEGVKEVEGGAHANEFWREETGAKFIELWDSINEKRGFGWDKNPFVWVIEFKLMENAR